MMILSRIWYVILALLLAAAFYVVSLAVGQYNRRNRAAMDETLKADSQVVSWALQVDARRRLDALLLAASDPAMTKALRTAHGREPIPVASKDEGVKALRAFNEKLPPDYKNDVVFATDRDGRLVAQIGYDQLNAFPEFELGGYAAVFDALHGFLRDDTWAFGGRLARVVARPVEDEVGQPPLGAIVALRWVDNGFTKEIAKRTRTNLAFFALSQRVASAASTEGFEEGSLEALGSDLKAVSEDKQWKKDGRTDVRPLGTDERGGVLFVRMPGDAWELGGGFAVARPRVSISSMLGFIQGADDQDKRNVKLGLVLLVAFGAAGIGILFSFLEHSMPLREMARQAEKLKKGEIDTLQLPRFRGVYRPVASDINAGIQRVVEKGGGTARKPADLESILGPVPAKPNMSAFAFGGGDGAGPSATSQAPPAGPPPTVSSPPFGVPPAGPSRPAPSAPSISGAPPKPFGAERTLAMSGAPPPPVPSRPTPAASPSGSGAFTPPPGALGGATLPAGSSGTIAGFPPNRPPPPVSAPAAATPPPMPSPLSAPAAAPKEEEATLVGQPSADLIAAAAAEPAPEWHSVYDEFLRTKRACGEPVEGLTYEKFQQTLKKNRDALMQRHGCKRVKFSVYVKEGRASLKATPVRE